MKKDRTFEIDKVKFELQVIPPLAGWDICELFREAVGRPEVLLSVTQDGKDGKDKIKRAIAGLLLCMSRQHVKALRDAIFEYVTFKRPEQPKPMTLAGVEDMAFEGMDPFAVYEVLGRAFHVNFTEYFNKMLGRLGIDVSALGSEESSTSPSEHGASPSS